MILLIDNYDSFVHNLARYFRRLGLETVVVRNDAIRPDDVPAWRPSAIVLSPGPCTPHQAGCSLELVGRFHKAIPMLGVCLGHQAIGLGFGGEIVRAPRPMHGKTSMIEHDGRGVPHVVKVLTDRQGYALYFSRAVIPWDRDAFAVTTEELPENAEHYRHLGIYAYRDGFIREYVSWPACHLETMESLEQLRVLWHGRRIQVDVALDTPGPGVDTPADLERVRGLMQSKGQV